MKTTQIKSLAERYGITLVYLFGSQAMKGQNFLKGEDTAPEERSDLDIAVAFKDIPSEPLKTYGELFKELSGLLVIIAGYRNRMVHFYREITPKEFFQITKNNLRDIDRFIKEIASFIRAYKQQNNKPTS